MLSIGNKKYRNLQEQVAYNTECIEELNKAIDGITLEDKLVIIANDSGTFTDEEMTVLNGPLAFISDGSKVWLKQSETVSEFVFKAIDIVATEQGGTHYNVGGSKIVVTRATRAYITSDDVIIVTYNKSQMDSLLALKADLSGANFTGAITAPSIIETMTGYSFSQMSATLWTPIYIGAVKTGNKLTIVLSGTFNRGDSGSGNPNLCYVRIPSQVGAKLFPWTEQVLEQKVINFQKSAFNQTAIQIRTVKEDNSTLRYQIYGIDTLDASTDYYFRIEQTFLLSDSLAQ